LHLTQFFRVKSMLRLSFAVAALVTAIAATPGFSDDLTDADLLALFQNQRDAFVAARSGGQGQTRGLTLVAIEDIESATIKVEPIAPEMVVTAEDPPAIILPTPDSATAQLSIAAPLEKPDNDQVAVVDANPPDPTPVVFGNFAPELQVNLNIEFAFDSATLQPDQAPILAQMCRVMKSSDIALFRIVGHTDASGTAEYNQTLSQLRAEEVQRYLVNDCGIKPTRLEALGLGEQFLSDTQDPKAAVNRRVEFQALS
jgi:OmpA-OmpF porin, OOP family